MLAHDANTPASIASRNGLVMATKRATESIEFVFSEAVWLEVFLVLIPPRSLSGNGMGSPWVVELIKRWDKAYLWRGVME